MSSFFSRERFKALLLHGLFSVFLLVIALYLVYGVWYPRPLAAAMGVGSLYVLMLAIDLILGPLLTFIVYKADKKKLFIDMIVIVSVQLFAYAGGLYVMHQGKPAWLIFVKDDIELVSPININERYKQDLAEQFKIPFYKQPMWIVADYGNEPKRRQKLIDDEMFEGISIVVRPETYRTIDTKTTEIVNKLKPISTLNQFNTAGALKEELSDLKEDVKGWLPVKAPEKDMVALFDANGKPITIVDLRPWN